MSVVAGPRSVREIEVRQLNTLYQLLAALSRATGLHEVYQAAIESLLGATAADRASILTFDDDGVIRFKASQGLSLEYQQAVTGHTPWPKGTLGARPIVVPDVLADAGLAAYSDLFKREGIGALAFIPLGLDAGVFGKFMLYYAEPHDCTPDELALAEAIAAHVALATERKRVELECARSEQRLQAILDNSPTVIFLKDPGGRYLLINRRFEELFHVGKNEILGRTDHDIFPPEMADRLRENDLRVIAAGEPLSVEECVPQDDGPHTYISAKFALQENGNIAGVCGVATDITDRRRLESASLHLAAIVESSDDAILSKDLNGIITSWNKGAERLFGYTASEVIGKPVSILAPSERVNEMPHMLAKVRQGERVDHYETQRRTKDGKVLDVSLTVSPIRNSAGEIIGASKIARDISDRKQLEAATLHLAAIVESSDDAIISKDLNGRIKSWNKGAERLFGYTASEVLGKPVSILAPSERVNEMPDILSKVRRGERVDHYETQRRTKDGKVLDVSLTVSPIRNSAGEIIGASKIARDISDQKRAEKERVMLLGREHEARRTAELLNKVGPSLASQLDVQQLAQEVTDIATALVGAEFGSFFHNVVNEQGESYMLYTLSGVSREAFAGFPMPRNTGMFGPTFRGEGIVRCDDVTNDPRYGKNPPHYGMPKGHLPVRSYLAAPVTSRTGEVLGGLFFGHSQPGKFTANHESILLGVASQAGIAMDNARLFQQAQWVQAELKRSNDELRHLNQDLETFAYSASHDLQEPLRTISLCSQLLARDLGNDLPKGSAGYLSTIQVASNRMTALIQDLLAYTKATKYPEGLVKNVDSGAVLESTLQTLSGPISEAGAIVTYDNLPVLAIHEGGLPQIFQNLIGNAIKYRRDAPRIHVSAVERDGWYVFSVTDNGIGIEPQYAEQIFGIFKRLHSREKYEGSGIGLAICQRIVEQTGGRIWLEKSTPGEGSTFCFSMPANR
ncbi:MAG TPA: PAS domain S-box protein [Bryobacteraceae bacterium]|nr:PAS domain S-box protein [Bryobacteraceae bacterium]